MEEMKNRGYHPDETWYNPFYRGKTLGKDETFINTTAVAAEIEKDRLIYSEHNNDYLKECLDNLSGKGIIIDL